ncbi:methyltransferase regulatory domain-containing protein [Devosia honganensis]|uniref:Methyltransferase regulatory domain-containing protein n=1 Tax=Devosia honganensis TaxID=1610527 RepID=A0ABV7X329_9HYPH
MARAHAGYLTETPYIAQFWREHAPLWLGATLAALGRSAPARSGTRWCELGCGPGVGLLIHAASNPSIDFHGVDINPDHIDEARDLARAAGIGNAQFHLADFSAAGALPDFDYIISQGVYSWVSPEVRAAIRAFMGRKLRPGGVALLHYLSTPGASDLVALHGLFRALHRQPGATLEGAVEQGRAIIETLLANKAGYFTAHPAAAYKARQLATDALNYAIHDYLNDFYAPQPSARVMQEMGEVGLHFAGSAVPENNIDDFSVPQGLRALFARQASPELRETVRDLAGNQFSRMDLYLRDGAPLSADRHFAALHRLRFRALPGLPPEGRVTFSSLIGPIEGPADVFGPVLSRLARQEAVSYAQIEALPALAGSPALANQILHSLMGAGAIHPEADPMPAPDAARRLNAVLLERHRQGGFVPALAAPALGSGLSLDKALLDDLAAGKPVPAAVARLLPDPA